MAGSGLGGPESLLQRKCLHRARVHGAGAATSVKVDVAGSVCLVCPRDFRTRLRAVQHLRPHTDASGGCPAALLTGDYPVVLADARAAADVADRLRRRSCRARGVNLLGAAGEFCVSEVT